MTASGDHGGDSDQEVQVRVCQLLVLPAVNCGSATHSCGSRSEVLCICGLGSEAYITGADPNLNQ